MFNAFKVKRVMLKCDVRIDMCNIHKELYTIDVVATDTTSDL